MAAQAIQRTVRLLETRWARYTAFAAVAAAGVGQAVQTAFGFFGDRRLIVTNWDYPAFYAAGRMVLRGTGDLLYDRAAMGRLELEIAGEPVGGTGVLAFFNPAFFAAMMAPFATLDLHRSYQAWTLLSLGLLAVNVWLLWRAMPDLPRRWRIGLTAGFVTAVPVSYGLQHGQFSLILVTSWTSTFLLLRGGRDRWAGVALAPLLIKPELLIPAVLYLAWQRRWMAFQTLLPLTALAIAASFAVTGVPAGLHYPAYLLESTRWHESGVTTSTMFGWNGIVAMFLHDPAAPVARVFVVLLTAGTLIALVHATRTSGFARQWMLLSIATVLVDPHLYLQDTVLLALPAIVLFAEARPEHRRLGVWLLTGGWAVMALGTVPNQYLHVNAIALYAVAAGAGLLLWGRRIDELAMPRMPGRSAVTA